MRIAVTGATGFVGGRLVPELTRRGHYVLAYGRRPAADLPAGAVYTAWDLAAGPLASAPDVDAVVHCAACVADWGDDAAFVAANVDGTRAVLDTFRGAARVVHLSTASVYDPWAGKDRVVEDAPYAARYPNMYARTKVLAEEVVRRSGRPAVILRPHAVYGPGDRTLLPRVLAARRLGWLLAVGNGRNRVSVTHVDNLVHAIVSALEAEPRAGIFNIADPLAPSLDDLLRTLLRRLGLPARVAYVPRGLARPLAATLEAGYRLACVSHPPLLTRYIVTQLSQEYTLDIGRAQRVLGYQPAFTYLDGPL
jgi:nucleoside-diphosphate-sugar epimerase